MSVSVDNAVYTMCTDVNLMFVTGRIPVGKDFYRRDVGNHSIDPHSDRHLSTVLFTVSLTEQTT